MHTTYRTAPRLGRALFLLILLALLAGLIAVPATPARAFGANNGWTLVPGADVFNFRAVAARPNGGYVVAGTRNNRIWVQALDADGRIDERFGLLGIAYVEYPGRSVFVNRVVVAPDGKILVTGEAGEDFFVARFTADGRPDPTFGTGGKSLPISFSNATLSLALSNEVGYDLLIQPDGKIVVAGKGGSCGVFTCYGGGFGLIRLHADGRLDTSFGNGGRRLTTFDAGGFFEVDDGRVIKLVRLRNGKLLAVGESARSGFLLYGMALARYTADGDLDKSFDKDGKVAYAGLSPAIAALELADASVLVATSGGELVRILPDGRRDPTFGTGGVVKLNNFVPLQMELQQDGTIRALGSSLSQVRQLPGAAWFTADGKPDRRYGATGIITHQPIVQPGARLATSFLWDTFSLPDGRMVFLSLNREIDANNQIVTREYLLRLTRHGAQDPSGSAPPSQPNSFAQDDSYATVLGQTRTIAAPGVLANDRSPDGGTLSATLVGPPANGRVNLVSSGAFSYTPNAGFVGTDRFTYQVRSSKGAAAIATVTMRVNPIGGNVAPSAGSVGYDLLQDTPLIIPSPGVLTNGRDAERDDLTAELVAEPEHGVVELRPSGGYSYTPEPGFVGTDYFYFRAYDGLDWSEPVTVTLRVAATGSNVPPIAVGDRYFAQLNGALSVPAPGLIENDQDHNGDALTVSLVEGRGPSHGALELASDGSFTYIPNPGFSGEDEFTYALSDGVSAKQATVRIFVLEELVENPPNDDLELEVERPEPAQSWSVYLPKLQR